MAQGLDTRCQKCRKSTDAHTFLRVQTVALDEVVEEQRFCSWKCLLNWQIDVKTELAVSALILKGDGEK